MKKIDYIIIGLGNPGDKYKNTRHNIGWMCAEALIKKYHGEVKKISQLSYYSHIKIQNENILVAIPITYMNNTGLAVKYFHDNFNILTENIIIIVDEYNFPVGKLHIKSGGGDGGHTGVASIIEETGSSDFYRLRCGIGKNFESGELVNYVLSDFSSEEITAVETMIGNSILAMEYFVTNNKSRAMSMINSTKIFEKNII